MTTQKVPVFRRTKPEAATEPTSTAEETAVGKGRPTPTRKEAQAAAKARAKASQNPRAMRAERAARGRVVREGIRAGDERYLGRRDRGPMRRFIRDFVDSRVNIAEFTLPLLVASLVFQASGAVSLGAGLLNATMVVVVVDCTWMMFRLRRQLRRRFPGESTKGATFYTLTRVLQLRFLRIPKPQVKLGQRLPEQYR